jgi:photosystem II stability/assembly factor-like uncharacterized protein
VARLYASTGDAIARLDESDGAWNVTTSLDGSTAQCLAVDPRDGDVVYAGLRDGGVRRTSDGGLTWMDCVPYSDTEVAAGVRTRAGDADSTPGVSRWIAY